MLTKILLSFSLLVAPIYASALAITPKPIETCAPQIPYGIPTGKKQRTTTVCRTAYILNHDDSAKIPTWVAYTLTPAHTVGCVKRSNAFATDTAVDGANPGQYAKTGYDIGHMAPAGDMSWNYHVELESFMLSNMVPQLPRFNRGVWKRLEDQTRAWAHDRGHPIHIYTGPIYSKTDPTLPGSPVVVPNAFFKILTDTVTGEVMVFVFKHEASHAPLDAFLTSLAHVQQLTGITFPMPPSPKYAVNRLWSVETKSVRNAKSDTCSLPGN